MISGETHAAAPTGILLSSNTVMENSPVNTLVGILTAVDSDVGDSFSFALVSGTGDQDNNAFALDNNELYTKRYIDEDFEAGPKDFSIRLRVTDSTQLSYDQVFLIHLTDDRSEDQDGDGLTQAQEEDLYGTSDLKYDSDGDGVSDGAEVAAGTSPSDPNDWKQTTLLGWGKSDEGEQWIPEGGDYVLLATGQNHSLAMTAAGVISGWGGANKFGQTTPPAGLTNVVQLAAGGDYWRDDSAQSVALKGDGTVVAWGYGQAGYAEFVGGLSHVVAVAAGRCHCVALQSDGTVVTWGYNPFGSIDPPEGLDDVVAVSAGGYFSLALKGDGTVVAWGSNFDGANWSKPRVPTGLADVVAISAGRFHSLALKNDGTVVAWGNNVNGQTNVPAGLTGVTAVAAGGFHSLALRNDGSVVAWGLNSYGQTNVPTAAKSGVKLISAGLLHSLAVRESADLPTITSDPRILSAPGEAVDYQVQVSNAGPGGVVYSAIGLPPGMTIDPVTGIISGTLASPARRSIQVQAKTGQRTLTQSVWLGITEGSPPTSILLTPAAITENSPAGTVIGTLSAEDPDAGDTHTYEFVDGIGSDDNGIFRIEGDQLILNQAVTRDYETNASAFSIRVRAKDASLNPFEQAISLQFINDRTEDADGDGLTEQQEVDIYHTSDTNKDSDGDGFGDKFEVDRGFSPTDKNSFPTGRMILAWGKGDDGRTLPPLAVSDFIDVSAGERHSLALKSNGRVVAWGDDEYGQSTPPPDLQNVIAIGAGSVHSVALKKDGTVAAWGNDDAQQTEVPADLAGVVAVSAGAFHNLALMADGTVAAWGDDRYGQATVPDGLSNVVAVAAGGYHSLALKSDGTVVAWGSDWAGTTAVPVGLSGVVAISAGGFHSLALRYDGTVVAWGCNDDGQVTLPNGLANVTEISAGWWHSLALKADGTLVSWGKNTNGQTKIPDEAVQIRRIEAGVFHNLAIRQSSGFPAFADVSPVRSWPGETVSRAVAIQDAVVPSGSGALPYSAMGLPSDLTLDPATGMINGTMITGEKRACRISVDTDQGTLQHVIWFDTASGVAPTDITLIGNVVAENAPAGVVVGTLSATDPNAGDIHTFELPVSSDAPYNYHFKISGDKLVVANPLNVDYDAGITTIQIRVAAVDSANNRFEKNFVLQLTDDRTEDADGDGVSEAMEEDVFGTSDTHFDDLGTADADKDGMPGLIEYACNLNPKVPGPQVRLVSGAGSTAGLPAIDLVTDNQGRQFLRMEYLRRLGGDLTYSPQFASGLAPGDWQPAAQPVVTPVDSNWERCVVTDSFSTADAPRRFGRVAVQYHAVIDMTVDADGDGVNRALEEEVFGTSDSIAQDFTTLDQDGDGVPSMIEYAFNMDPKVAGPPIQLVAGAGSTAGLPVVSLVDDGLGGFHLRLEYLRRVGSILSYVPQFSSGLGAGDWQPASNPVSVTQIGTGWERCVVEDSVATTSSATRFARVAVSW